MPLYEMKATRCIIASPLPGLTPEKNYENKIIEQFNV